MKSNLAPLLGLLIACLVSPLSANEIAQKTCAACHGADGNSINPEWPNLAGQHAIYTMTQLKAYKDGVRQNPNMTSMVANLSDDDISALADFYAGKAQKIGQISADEINVGEKLYRGGDKERGIPACMACHGPNGAGNAAANYPSLSGQHGAYTINQLKAYRSGERKTGAEQKLAMQTIAQRMSDEDIEAVARYINALH